MEAIIVWLVIISIAVAVWGVLILALSSALSSCAEMYKAAEAKAEHTKELAEVTNNNAKYVAEMEKHYAGRLAKQDQCLIELGGAIDEMRQQMKNNDLAAKGTARELDKLKDAADADRSARPVAVLHALAAALEQVADQWQKKVGGQGHGEDLAVRGAKEWLTKNGVNHRDDDADFDGLPE